mmetsp:Transcript_36012/g.101977  ORF Transcript_36012/g.101977 Transcript_36012/m.101977 type:complete len:319 (+) Transcript_36012:371-1327(+)
MLWRQAPRTSANNAAVALLLVAVLSSLHPSPAAAHEEMDKPVQYYTPRWASRSLLQANAGFCDQTSNGGCDTFCKGFSSSNLASQHCRSVFANNQEIRASCVQSPAGAIVPCERTSVSRSPVDGCFCCCVRQTGDIDTGALVGNRCQPNAALDGSSCDRFCGGFRLVSNVCQSITSGSTNLRPSCARNSAGRQITCLQTSASRGGPNNCHCCCTAAEQPAVRASQVGNGTDQTDTPALALEAPPPPPAPESSALGWGLFAAVLVVVGGGTVAYFTICKPKQSTKTEEAAGPTAVPATAGGKADSGDAAKGEIKPSGTG